MKDKDPGNDQHISIITIEQPEEPKTPPPPPTPVGKPDLAVTKTTNQGACEAGRSGCGFTVTVTNVGNARFSGPINLADTVTPSSLSLTSSGPSPWKCRGSRGRFQCSHPPTTLQPGQSKVLSLTFSLPRKATGGINNCIALRWGGAGPSRSSTRNIQSALSARGFNPGPIDGKAGSKTTEAIRAFQSQQGLPPTGQVDQALLNALFGQPGAGDANPTNDQACAVSAIVGQPEPPPPPPCTGGRIRNNYGACVCPSNTPVWTGSRCVPRPPAPCSGGRIRNNYGACVCPPDKPNWSGSYCFAKEILCSGGRIRVGGNCVCPQDKPVWTGQICVPRPPQQCSGGRIRNNKGQCVCPASAPIWTGVICIPKITVCSGGRVLQNGKCVCPPDRPVWSGSQCNPAHQVCSGGRVYNERLRQCVCPPNKPSWNGSQCVLYQTNPGMSPGEIGTPPISGPTCTGGRIRKGNQCVCPPNKPIFAGGQCRSLPGGIKIPGLQIR